MRDWQWLAGLFLGLLFMAAGSVKIVYRTRFRDTLSAMEVLPRRLGTAVALALPPLEGTLGLAVLAGWQLAVSGPLLLALLCGFVIVLAHYRLRGGKELACGCLADFEKKTATSGLIVRNLLLLALGLPLLLPADRPAAGRGPTEWLAAALVVVGILLVWHLASRLVAVVTLLRAERRLARP
jgi:hypothetical protein